MQSNPQQTDPQSQPDVPPQLGANVKAQSSVPGAGQLVPPDSVVPGADVYGMDGKTIGTVREVYKDSILVHRGGFFRHDYYIPYRYVAGASSDEVNLTLMSHEAQSQNWSQRPGVTADAQTMPPSQTGQHSASPTTGGMAPASPQAAPDYGRAGSSDATWGGASRGLRGNQGMDVSDLGDLPPNIDPDQWASDVAGARDL